MRCFKPFDDAENCSRKLKQVTRFIANKSEKLNGLSDKDLQLKRICTSCDVKFRLYIKKETQISVASTEPTIIQEKEPVIGSTSSSSIDSPSSSEEILKKKRALEIFNKDFNIRGKQPVFPSKAHQKSSVERISQVVKEFSETLSVPSITPIQPNEQNKIIFYDEMISQLKQKYDTVSKTNEKIQVLTALPKSMSENNIIKEFGCGRHLVRTAKQIQKTQGALSMPEPKKGSKSISQVFLKI